MNWGIRIAALYAGFVVLILTLVFTCYGSATELESKDYYTRELKFQEQINATNNARALNKPLKISLNERAVEFEFPEELAGNGLSGTIFFLRPSDAGRDREFTIRPDKDSKQTIFDPGFIPGVYKVQVHFNSGGKKYYHEEVLYLN